MEKATMESERLPIGTPVRTLCSTRHYDIRLLGENKEGVVVGYCTIGYTYRTSLPYGQNFPHWYIVKIDDQVYELNEETDFQVSSPNWEFIREKERKEVT